MVSPGSAKPARHDHMVGANRGERPSTQRSPAIASMMTTGSVRGKCSRLADGQSRRQPACTDLRRRAAIGTETVARMPAEQRLGFGERRQMLGADEALHRDAAQVGDFQIVARFERLERAADRGRNRNAARRPRGRERRVSRRAPSASASAGENSGCRSLPMRRRCFSAPQLAADHIDAGDDRA